MRRSECESHSYPVEELNDCPQFLDLLQHTLPRLPPTPDKILLSVHREECISFREDFSIRAAQILEEAADNISFLAVFDTSEVCFLHLSPAYN